MEKISRTRGRIDTEEKAKVVAVFWGTEFLQFLAALAVLHQDELKKKAELHPILKKFNSGRVEE